ncbi:MAG: efflux RND transporter periplasmic adaptor subunit [Phyllobacteriaceae bacterium]|nr:efflux RND transporter periplasmic adaptor subunit [Phyllobacteriaceae bacterium]
MSSPLESLPPSASDRPRRRGSPVVAAAGFAVAAVLLARSGLPTSFAPPAEATVTAAPAPPPAVPVTVATVARRDTMFWDAFSGRLEAVEKVEVRARVAGMVEAVHFAEGRPVAVGDRLVTIDPAPYAAIVARAEAQVSAAEARLATARSDLERGQKLWDTRTVSSRELDGRVAAEKEAEADLRAARASLTSARLDLGYTEIVAPVAGRAGRREITVGNLVAGGPSAPVLTTLLSIDPIYASFDVDESILRQTLAGLSGGSGVRTGLDRIPVEMTTADGRDAVAGRLQLIDNRVDTASGTVHLRAVFANPTGALLPGQFVHLKMGRSKAEPVLLVDERAVGTDQDKRYVMVVDPDDRAAFRLVTLGRSVDGLRVVTSGLSAGERVIVNGLQRVRPGSPVKAQEVAMGARGTPHLASSD